MINPREWDVWKLEKEVFRKELSIPPNSLEKSNKMRFKRIP